MDGILTNPFFQAMAFTSALWEQKGLGSITVQKTAAISSFL